MQRYCILGITAVLVVIALLNTQAADAEILYRYSGSGNLLESPVVYSGTIDHSSDPRLAGGYWEIVIDDTGWPSPADKAARWNYIWARFFAENYNPYEFNWTAYFNDVTVGRPLSWRVGRPFIGELSGRVDLQVRIFDQDADTVIDPDELEFAEFSGAIVVNHTTGFWLLGCGIGFFYCERVKSDPLNWVDDLITNGEARIQLESCAVPTRTSTWGHVKHRYE